MTIVRALDVNHDWTFGKGKNDYLRNINAIVQNINTRLNCFLGDCFFDLASGIDWWTRLGGSKDQVALRLDIATVILNTEGVTGILLLSTLLDPRTRRFTVKYQVSTTYSAQTSGTVSLTTTGGSNA